MWSKPQTPRAGRRREGGLADFETDGRRSLAGSPLRSGVARDLSPRVRTDPGVPRPLGLCPRGADSVRRNPPAVASATLRVAVRAQVAKDAACARRRALNPFAAHRFRNAQKTICWNFSLSRCAIVSSNQLSPEKIDAKADCHARSRFGHPHGRFAGGRCTDHPRRLQHSEGCEFHPDRESRLRAASRPLVRAVSYADLPPWPLLVRALLTATNRRLKSGPENRRTLRRFFVFCGAGVRNPSQPRPDKCPHADGTGQRLRCLIVVSCSPSPLGHPSIIVIQGVDPCA